MISAMRSFPVIVRLGCALSLLLSGCSRQGTAGQAPIQFIKGMTVSAQTWGWEWATP